MFRRPIKEINAEFEAEDKYLDSIQRTVKESCTAASMSKKDIAAVLLAIEEGATNIIRHAYLYEKGIMRLRIVIYKRSIVFSLIDYGRSFQPNTTGTIDLKKLVESGRKGGLGFYMIQKIMNSVEYISTASFNELRMVKHIKESRSANRPFLRRMFSLRFKFSVWTFIVVSMIIGGSIYYFDYRISEDMYKHKDETVLALGKTIAAQAVGYFINHRSDAEFDDMIVSNKQANPELKQIVLTDENGFIRAHSDDILNIRKHYLSPQQVNVNLMLEPQDLKIGRLNYKYVIIPIQLNQSRFGNVHITYSTEQIYQKLKEARTKIFLLTLVLLAFGIIGIYMLSNYFVSPILKITHRIRRFTSGDLETELPLEGAEEFFEISKAFNQMITRLSQDRKNIAEREKMAKEIEVASEIQKTLLPHKLPNIQNLEVETFYRAASIVGGDLYDVFDMGEGKYCLVVADVSGKGVPASLVMSMLRTIIQISAARFDSAKIILIEVNNYLKKNIPPGMFVTVFLLVFDSKAHRLQFVSAGHNPMLFYNAAKDEITKLNPKGMPLGLPTYDVNKFADSLEEAELLLDRGDSFIVFTDGVTEATSRDGEQFGLTRLLSLFSKTLNENWDNEISKISDNIISGLDEFTGFTKTTDDISYIVGRCCPYSHSEESEEVEVKNLENDGNHS